MMDMTVEEEKQYAEKMRLLQQQQNTQPQTLAPTVESQVSAPVQSQAPAPLGMAANALRTQELTNSFLGPAASPEEIEAEEQSKLLVIVLDHLDKKTTANTWKSLKGKYKNSLSSVDEFIARKQVEKRLEL